MKTISLFLLFAFIASISFSQPVITSFSPAAGPVGSIVTITGSNFSSVSNNNIVFFGAVKATVNTSSTFSITVTVPSGATYQPITVITNSLTGYSKKPFIVTFPGAGNGFTTNSFADVADSITGSTPYDVIACDIDGDRKPDVLTANNIGNTLSIHRNTSTSGIISFALKLDIAIGSGPYGITAADIDGDGKQDIAVTNYNDNNVSILRNISTPGNISFAPAINFATGSGPQHVAIYDLDNDGKPDLAVANSFANTISLLRNTGSKGTIAFATNMDVSLGNFPVRIAIGDLDGDGKPDIGVACKVSDGIRILRNQSTIGTFSFTSGFTLPTGRSPTGIAIGDLDGDGIPDLAVSNSLSNQFTGVSTFTVLRNISSVGNISFSRTDITTVGNPQNIGITDLDGNGQPDIAVTLFNSHTTLFNNTSTAGAISFGTGVKCPATSPFHLAISDMDGDGKTDMVEASLVSSKISALRNRLTEPVITSFSPTTVGSGGTVTITGINFTGATAVSFGGVSAASFNIVNATTITAVVGAGASGNITVVTPKGTASIPGFSIILAPVINSFTPTSAGAGPTVTITGSYLSGATAVSFGGIAATSFTVISATTIKAVVGLGATGNVSVTSAYGTGSLAGFTFFQPPTITSFTPTSGFTGTVVHITGTNLSGADSVLFGGVAAASFTVLSPTTIDATVGEGATGSVSITTPGGANTKNLFVFAPPIISFFTPASGAPGTKVTIKGNNFSAIAANNIVYFGAVKATVLSAGNTSLSVQVPIGTTSQPITVTTHGATAIANQPFRLTFNGGSSFTASSFKWKAGFTTGDNPERIITADLDGDGKVDYIVSNQLDGNVVALRNTSSVGNVSFAPPIDFSGTYYSATETATADFNSDGKLDVGITSFYGGVTRVFINTSSPGSISFAPYINLPLVYFRPRGMITGDFDGDSKPDIAVADFDAINNNQVICIFRNTGINGSAAFSRIDHVISGVNTIGGLFAGDLNQDNKTDLILTSNTLNSICVLPNISVGGTINFGPITPLSLADANVLTIADLNNDGKPDIITSSTLNKNVFSVIKNTSTGGNFSFSAQGTYNTGFNINKAVVGELNGDNSPDIIIVNYGLKSIALYKNNSTSGAFLFDPTVNYYSMLGYNWSDDACVADIDGDGKNDIGTANGSDNKISVFRNQANESVNTQLCPPVSNVMIPSGLTGTSYQWKLNTGNGFINIVNNANYGGANTANLQLSNVPSAFYGFEYICVADSIYSEIFSLQFLNMWNGSGSNVWENPANWSCGSLPDGNTDVIIDSGSVILNSNTSIRSLKLNAGASFTINSPFTLKILH